MATPKNPLVSVSIITYQHAAFITACLEGVLTQKTDFKFEILIGEDGSTDGTREICIEYAERFPDKIRLFLHNPDRSNINNDPAPWRNNFNNNLQQAKGKYIALCEGDDYWTDSNKLQKQVNFLEKNDDFSICYHNVLILENGQFTDSHVSVYPNKDFLTIVDLAHENFIHTPSCMFRNHLLGKFPNIFNNCPAGDYVLHLLNAQHGKIKYLPEKMAVYRRHPGGAWASRTLMSKLTSWLNVLKPLMYYFKEDPEIYNALQTQHLNTLIQLVKVSCSTNDKNHLVTALLNADRSELEHVAEFIIESCAKENNYLDIDYLIKRISINKLLIIFLKKLYFSLKNLIEHTYAAH